MAIAKITAGNFSLTSTWKVSSYVIASDNYYTVSNKTVGKKVVTFSFAGVIPAGAKIKSANVTATFSSVSGACMIDGVSVRAGSAVTQPVSGITASSTSKNVTFEFSATTSATPPTGNRSRSVSVSGISLSIEYEETYSTFSVTNTTVIVGEQAYDATASLSAYASGGSSAYTNKIMLEVPGQEALTAERTGAGELTLQIPASYVGADAYASGTLTCQCLNGSSVLKTTEFPIRINAGSSIYSVLEQPADWLTPHDDFNGRYLSGVTSYNAKWNFDTIYGATCTTQSVTVAYGSATMVLDASVTGGNGHYVVSASIPAINFVGDLVVSVTATDSRGRSDAIEVNLISQTGYVPPQIDVTSGNNMIARSDAQGTPDATGDYVTVRVGFSADSALSGNTITDVALYLDSRQVDASKADLQAGVTLPASGDAGHVVQINVTDATGGTNIVVVEIPTAEVFMDWDPVNKIFAIGTVSPHKVTQEKRKVVIGSNWDIAQYDAENVALNLFEKMRSVLLEAWPVGSIYMSTNAVSPQTLFGGTWRQLKDTFLLAAGDTYAAGSTGGEATHTLSVGEMPSHAHEESMPCVISNAYTARPAGAASASPYTSPTPTSDGAYKGFTGLTASSSATASVPLYPIITTASGEGSGHNNMPPYLSVYCWERLA